MYELQSQYKQYFDPDLTYQDYMHMIRAKSGDYAKRNKDQMASLVPFFDKGYLESNRQGDIWLTVLGTRVLQAAGCDPLDPREFAQTYPHMLDLMRDD